MPRWKFICSRCAVLIFLFVLVLVLAILAAPTRSLARSAMRAQNSNQDTAPGSRASSKRGVVMPEGDGKAIATEYCQECHELSYITKAHKTSDDWQATVQAMIDKGAGVPADKVDTLVRYLTKNFGFEESEPVSSAPAVAANPPAAVSPSDGPVATASQAAKPTVELPDGDGKEIATEYCQTCHRLTNLTKAHKTLDDWQDAVQTMIERGARIPPEKVDTLVQYLAKNFGPQTPQTTAPAGTVPPSAPSNGPSPGNR
jgi:cytochrome c5